MLITHIRGLLTPLITTPEPPSYDSKAPNRIALISTPVLQRLPFEAGTCEGLQTGRRRGP